MSQPSPSLWIPAHRLRRVLSYGLLVIAGILAFALGKLSITGIIWAGVLLTTGRYYHHEISYIRYASRWIFLGLVLALGFGILPGFEVITLHHAEVLKSGSAEYFPAAGFLVVWALSNMLFVTGVEEGFFRGLIQNSLRPRIGTYGAITTGAILFGLAHFGGGALYVMLATQAGIGYGLAYHLSGQRIEAAMLAHFGVNLLHLLLFTYPYAK